MKKSLGLKICAGIAVVAAMALLPTKTYASTNTYLRINDNEKNLIANGPNSTASNLDGTATYKGDEKILILANYQGGTIQTDIDALTIIVTGDSVITSRSGAAIDSTGSVTISANKNEKLTANGGISITGAFTLSSGVLDLGTGDLKVTNNNLKINGGELSAGSILLTDTDSASQSKITIEKDAVVKAKKSISAVYSFAAKDKGILLANNICANPAAEITNVAGSGSSRITTTFTTASAANGITTGIELSSAACGATASVDNPDTFDMVYVYAAILVASSAILGYRRYIAKR